MKKMQKSRLLFRRVIATKRFKFSLVPKHRLPRRWFLLSELNPNRWLPLRPFSSLSSAERLAAPDAASIVARERGGRQVSSFYKKYQSGGKQSDLFLFTWITYIPNSPPNYTALFLSPFFDLELCPINQLIFF